MRGCVSGRKRGRVSYILSVIRLHELFMNNNKQSGYDYIGMPHTGHIHPTACSSPLLCD